jgi:ABC-type antimicrobial peptide transport system permease subunit
MKKWVILARHNWLSECTITESYSTNNSYIRRFTATIKGWRNFKIYEGTISHNTIQKIIAQVRYIRDRIEKEDESIFTENTMITELEE